MRVLSGMRPTGKLHLGHWVGALSNWVRLQDDNECLFMVADWHALMSEYKNSYRIKDIIFDNVCDWLASGIDPTKSIIFVQSHVYQHLELFIILGFITPLGMLSRCPTFKEQLRQLKDKEVNTYSFLGYPLLQSVDIIIYKAEGVPVGEDQLPHLELSREIVRRFHNIYNREVFIEPQPILTDVPRLLGLDGRKMSKSYNNYISLDERDENIKEKVLSMITDPQRIRKSDPGHPEVCNVYQYYMYFAPKKKEEVYEWCTQALRGCLDCKKELSKIIIDFIRPHRERKQKFLFKKDLVWNILEDGRKRAQKLAEDTLYEVKNIMGLL